MFDLMLTNASLLDGTGQSAYQADLAIKGNRIAAVGDLAAFPTRITIKANGATLMPLRANNLQRPATTIDLPASEVVPATSSARLTAT